MKWFIKGKELAFEFNHCVDEETFGIMVLFPSWIFLPTLMFFQAVHLLVPYANLIQVLEKFVEDFKYNTESLVMWQYISF